MPAAPDTANLGFSISVPSSWFELDLHPATRDQSISTLVDERLREVPELFEQRTSIARLLRQNAREAWDSGATFCGVMVEPTDDGPVTASVTVTLGTGPSPGEDDRDTRLEEILETLTVKQAKGEDDTWSSATTVEIPEVGTCARSLGVEDIDLPEGAGWVRVVQMQTFVPMPGSGSVLIVSCSSPVLPLVDVLLDLFDAVSGTFRLVELPQ